MPQSIDSEKLVLGTLMTDRNALNEVRELLTPDTFYDKFHSQIYKAILDIADKGNRPDMIIVKNKLESDGVEFNLIDFVNIAGCRTFDVYQHAAIVHDKAKRREFFEIGQYLITNCFSEEYDLEDVLQDTRDKLDGIFVDSSSNISTMKDAVEGVYKQIELNLSGKTGLTGSPTGFTEFDDRSGGLQKSDLIIIAADTSSGKTSLSMKIAMNAGCNIAFYSMEMKKEQIAARMLSIQSGVPANIIQYSRMTDVQLSMIDSGIAKILDKPVFFDDRSTSSIDSILASIRSLKIKQNIDGVIVDYLQILTVNQKGLNKEQQLADAARRLKNIAKELDIWVIALSQLNRDAANPVPSLGRLRDSGQIAEAADTVILIYRPENYDRSYPEPFKNANTSGTAMIDIAKGRNVGTFKFLVGFKAETTNFYELNEVPFAPTDEQPF